MKSKSTHIEFKLRCASCGEVMLIEIRATNIGRIRDKAKVGDNNEVQNMRP